MNADVDAREGDRDGQQKGARREAPEQVGEHDGAGEARGRVSRRHRLGHGTPEQGVRLRNRLERARTIGHDLDRERDEIRRPDGRRGERDCERQMPPGQNGKQGCEHDPDQPFVADHRQADEDGIEPADAMFDDPEEYRAVYARRPTPG